MNLLLFQPADLTEDDKVFRDGALLTQFYERDKAYQNIIHLFDGVDNSTCPWVGRVGKYYLIRGLFNGVDEKGRKLSFLFASNDTSFVDDLYSMENVIGLTISDGTKSIISSFVEKTKKKPLMTRVIIFACFIVLLLIILIVLWNLRQTS